MVGIVAGLVTRCKLGQLALRKRLIAIFEINPYPYLAIQTGAVSG